MTAAKLEEAARVCVMKPILRSPSRNALNNNLCFAFDKDFASVGRSVARRWRSGEYELVNIHWIGPMSSQSLWQMRGFFCTSNLVRPHQTFPSLPLPPPSAAYRLLGRSLTVVSLW